MADAAVDVNFITQVVDVSDEELRQLLHDGYSIIKAHISPLTGYDDLNFIVERCVFEAPEMIGRGDKFVAKLTNPVEMRVPEVVTAQCKLIDTLTAAGVPCAQPLARRDGAVWAFVNLADGKRSALKLFNFLPGRTLERFWRDGAVPPASVLRTVGRLLASFHNAVDTLDASSTAAFRHYYPLISARGWKFLRAEAKLHAHQISADRAALCERIFSQFQIEVLDQADKFEQGIIHSDFNGSNILLDFNTSGEVVITGLLDFGDTHYSLRIIDLANTILYVFLDRFALGSDLAADSSTFCAALRDTAADILRAYDALRVLKANADTMKERRALSICVKARLVASLIYGLHVLRIRHRTSSDWAYISQTQTHGWRLLERFCDTDLDTVFGNAVESAKCHL